MVGQHLQPEILAAHAAAHRSGGVTAIPGMLWYVMPAFIFARFLQGSCKGYSH